MSATSYSPAVSFNVNCRYLQASALPPVKPSGAALTRVQNLLTALSAVSAADLAMAARTSPPAGGKTYTALASSEAWAAVNTLTAWCQALVGGLTSVSPF